MRRRVILLLAAVTIFLVVASGEAGAQETTRCVAGANPCFCPTFFCQGSGSNDRIEAFNADNAMNGAAGNDILNSRGSVLEDVLDGGPGNDVLNGGDLDTFGADNDLYIFQGNWGRDNIVSDASGQFDRIEFRTSAPVFFDMVPVSQLDEAVSGTNALNIFPGVVIEGVSGGGGDDVIFGDNLDNSIGGGTGGNDILQGRGGNDSLDGGRGIDRLDGGNGRDSINGGDGNDVIMAQDGQVDTVTCGSGTDTTFFDVGADSVSIDCEDRRGSGIVNPGLPS